MFSLQDNTTKEADRMTNQENNAYKANRMTS